MFITILMMFLAIVVRFLVLVFLGCVLLLVRMLLPGFLVLCLWVLVFLVVLLGFQDRCLERYGF
ncbi:MAG: hypothetical protein RQ855_02840 [Desulfurococcales archaeon]|nr:hypothetical protein [Desulfurococcales archaeon]